MKISPTTSTLLHTLEEFSGNKLTRLEDLGILLELGATDNLQQTLDELSFTAKFLAKTAAIMKRIGREGDGYIKLSEQFSKNMEKARQLLRTIFSRAPTEIGEQLTSTYLAVTPESLQNLLELYYDLSWYKNWQIDNRKRNART